MNRTKLFVFALALSMLIVGSARNSAAPQAAYTVVDLTPTTYGGLVGNGNVGIPLNDAGQVTGYFYTDPDVRQHAFLYSNGVPTDLLTLGGLGSWGRSINASGQVTGSSHTALGAIHAFRYTAGVGMVDLGSFLTHSEGYAINASGQVAGDAYVSNNAPRAFFYSDGGGMKDIGTLGEATSSARAINDSGQVVGQALTPRGGSRAFLYTSSTNSLIEIAFPGSSGGGATAINSLGQVTGGAVTVSGQSHAFIYASADGTMTDLGTAGGVFSQGTAINDAGQVTGLLFTTVSFADRHAFRYSNGTMTDLGTFGGTQSWGLAINASGHVTGYATGVNGERRAFLYNGVAMIDLNTLIPAGSGWFLQVGSAINDSGQIAGTGVFNGQLHAFLLTPAGDVTPPDFDPASWPGDQAAEATGPLGATVNYPQPTATDLVDGTVQVECRPLSGSQFALGETTVRCTATDSSGNEAADTFKVTITDTTPPTLTVPPDQSVNATSRSGAAVTFSPSPSASDLVDGSILVDCTPADGSFFAIATTPVTCTATDAHGNTSSPGSFQVTVLGADNQIRDLMDALSTLNVPPGLESSLTSKLQSALDLLSQGRVTGACSKLRDFINQVTSSTPKRISQPDSDFLIGEATRIRAVIGC
jgi:probable HAF family extracellular repeat protein